MRKIEIPGFTGYISDPPKWPAPRKDALHAVSLMPPVETIPDDCELARMAEIAWKEHLAGNSIPLP